MRLPFKSAFYQSGLSVFVTLCLAALAGCGLSLAGPTATTNVAPLATEDLAAPCTYDLLLQTPGTATKGLLVIFERGDSKNLYNDLSVRQAAGSLGFGILFAHECDAKSSGDLQADAAKGPARALTTALHQLALNTLHPELDSVGMVLYGFSAGGVLTATMANTLPGRMMGAIEYAAGSTYTNLDHVLPSAAATAIPTLILANAQDEDAGTTRNYNYFLRGRAAGTPPWAYAVQNATGHCCNLSTLDLVLPWIKAIASQQASLATTAADLQAFAPVTTGGEPKIGRQGQFTCTPDGIVDAQGEVDCSFSAASLGAATSAATQPAWLPDAVTANAWLAWTTNPTTN